MAAGEPAACASPSSTGATGGSSCGPATAADGRPGANQRNLRGGPLETCSTRPTTGWFRDGRCATDEEDRGSHTVCAVVDDAFLAFTRSRGNDLVTPRDSFPGLRAGDRWCLCAARWEEARAAGVAPRVVVEATNEAATRAADREALLSSAIR
ncbi:DUF2237 family protein [bacterium]|nr:DUF2237 family protein [bacterium]